MNKSWTQGQPVQILHKFDPRAGVNTREVSDGLNVDLDSVSDVVGFDIDRASLRLTLESGPLTGKDE